MLIMVEGILADWWRCSNKEYELLIDYYCRGNIYKPIENKCMAFETSLVSGQGNAVVSG